LTCTGAFVALFLKMAPPKQSVEYSKRGRFQRLMLP
jgi:hypothetical protein